MHGVWWHSSRSHSQSVNDVLEVNRNESHKYQFYGRKTTTKKCLFCSLSLLLLLKTFCIIWFFDFLQKVLRYLFVIFISLKTIPIVISFTYVMCICFSADSIISLNWAPKIDLFLFVGIKLVRHFIWYSLCTLFSSFCKRWASIFFFHHFFLIFLSNIECASVYYLHLRWRIYRVCVYFFFSVSF